MFSDHPFDIEDGDSSCYCLTVRVTAPCHVAALVHATLADPGTFRRLDYDDWCAGTLPVRPEHLSPEAFQLKVRALTRVILCFEADFATRTGGVFRGLTEQQLRDTFLSFPEAMGVWLEESADLDAAAWEALAEALPLYPNLRRLELHGVRMPGKSVVRMKLAAPKCLALRGLSFGVDWDGVIKQRAPAAPCAGVTSLAIAGIAVQSLAKASAWIWKFPRLQRLKIGMTASEDVHAVFDGLKRGIIYSMRQNGLRQMAACEVIILHDPPGERSSASISRCTILDPHVKCALGLRDEDYTYARAHGASEAPYSVVQSDKWTTARLGPGTFEALRYRQWMRYAVLGSFLRYLRDSETPESRNPWLVDPQLVETLARLARLPGDIWPSVLEWWLGGRLLLGVSHDDGEAMSGAETSMVPSS